MPAELAPHGLLSLQNWELGQTSLLNKFTGPKHFDTATESALRHESSLYCKNDSPFQYGLLEKKAKG